MSIAEQLQKKKAQLAQVQTRERQLKLGDTECSSTEDYLRLMNETQFEQYYTIIKPYTFNSTMMRLTPEAAQAIMEGYNALHPKGKDPKPFDASLNPPLVKLAQDIDDAKAKHLTTADMFVRLSSRSPKDAAIGARGIKIYEESKKKVTAINKEANDSLSTEDNTKLHALYITGTEALRIKTGAEAVDLFINSSRIQDDLMYYLKDTSKEFNVVVREFANFEVELEFRGFVYGKKFTALTQYNQFCYFPRVVKHKSDICETVKKFIEQELIHKIPLDNFVLDLMLVSQTPEQGPYSNLKVYIVEINPFAEFAGEGLFSWVDPSEVDILKGRAPFEFRVVQSPPPGAIQNIDHDWRLFIEHDKS